MAGRLDRTSTLRDLLANGTAEAALTQALGPAFLQAPGLAAMLDKPLVQVADLAPQVLTAEKLDEIEAALNKRPS